MFEGLVTLPWWGHVLAALAMTHATIAAVTIYLHRHQSHRALELSPFVAHVFRLWLWLTTGMITREWAAIHRKHHAKCETADDPHSPQVLGLNRVLWLGVFLYISESRNAETIERYGQGTPDDWLERNVYTPLHKFGIVLMLAIDLWLFGVVPGAAIWIVQMVWIPFWAAGVINGVGHWWGYRNFACADASTNIVPIGVLVGGEELHNNHHAHPGSARLSVRPYEFDIGWLYIRLLEWAGQAKVKKVAPRLRLAAARANIDADNLRAIMTHRYEVMARYLKSLRKVASEEFERLRVTAGERRSLGQLLRAPAPTLSESARSYLAEMFGRSPRLATVYAMRGELEALWARSNETREQLLRDLQDWAARAEASGIRQLEEFSLRLRRYAM